jgi:hypothetical protein
MNFIEILSCLLYLIGIIYIYIWYNKKVSAEHASYAHGLAVLSAILAGICIVFYKFLTYIFIS